MELSDVVWVQAYVTRHENVDAYQAARNERVELACPAHTLRVVRALGRPEWEVEIEAVAARA